MISAVHRGFAGGSTLGNNPIITQILMGTFNQRPPQKRLAPFRSINDVIQTLAKPPYEPLHNAPLNLLTKKTLPGSSSVGQEKGLPPSSHDKVRLPKFEPGGVRLIPDPQFRANNQSMTFTPEEIFRPTFSSVSSIHEDKRWCPVRALKWYIERTRDIRISERLFIIPCSPYNPASKDTISRWIVDLIKSSYPTG